MKKNAILKGISYGVMLVFLVSACGIDSASWLPAIVCAVCGGYLALFSYVNRDYEIKHREDTATGYYRLTHILEDKENGR